MKYMLVFWALFILSTNVQGNECPRLSRGIRVSAVGDILVHEVLFRAALKEKSRFRALWSNLTPTLKDADLTVGNLEGPVAPGVAGGGKAVADVGLVYDGTVYSGSNFLFNYHPALLEDLVFSGFGLVTTANNHALDRGSLGVDRTIEQLTQAHLPFIGTRAHDSKSLRGEVLSVGSYRLGVIACTEMINGFSDRFDQVLKCGSPEIVGLIDNLKQRSDAVLVFPHWGNEYEPRPDAAQKSWARKWIEAGAAAVIGNHPHVLQTVEWITRSNGSRGLVIYSLGNFVAAQGAMEKKVSAVVHLDFLPSSTGLELAQFSYLPLHRPAGSLAITLLNRDSVELRHAREQLGPAVCQ